MFHEYFQLRAVPAYYPVQVKATSILLQQLLESPDETTHHVRQYAPSAMFIERKTDDLLATPAQSSWKTVYGYDVNPRGDRLWDWWIGLWKVFISVRM